MDFSHWNSLTVQLTSIFLTFVLIMAISITYNVKIRAHDDTKKMSGFLIIVELFVGWVEDLVVGIMGVRYRKLTPYAMYLILYIFIGGIFSVMGFDSLATSYTVTFSMGFVTFIMIYYFGFKYQKWGFLKQYRNPIEILTQFTPLISISFRLFGNILGGSVILGLLYAMLIGMQASWNGGSANGIWNLDWTTGQKPFLESTWKDQYEYFWSGFNILAIAITPFLHLYFDVFDSGVQALVFTMLTFSYWAEAMGEPNTGKISQRRSHKPKGEERTLLL